MGDRISSFDSTKKGNYSVQPKGASIHDQDAHEFHLQPSEFIPHPKPPKNPIEELKKIDVPDLENKTRDEKLVWHYVTELKGLPIPTLRQEKARVYEAAASALDYLPEEPKDKSRDPYSELREALKKIEKKYDPESSQGGTPTADSPRGESKRSSEVSSIGSPVSRDMINTPSSDSLTSYTESSQGTPTADSPPEDSKPSSKVSSKKNKVFSSLTDFENEAKDSGTISNESWLQMAKIRLSEEERVLHKKRQNLALEAEIDKHAQQTEAIRNAIRTLETWQSSAARFRQEAKKARPEHEKLKIQLAEAKAELQILESNYELGRITLEDRSGNLPALTRELNKLAFEPSQKLRKKIKDLQTSAVAVEQGSGSNRSQSNPRDDAQKDEAVKRYYFARVYSTDFETAYQEARQLKISAPSFHVAKPEERADYKALLELQKEPFWEPFMTFWKKPAQSEKFLLDAWKAFIKDEENQSYKTWWWFDPVESACKKHSKVKAAQLKEHGKQFQFGELANEYREKSKQHAHSLLPNDVAISDLFSMRQEPYWENFEDLLKTDDYKDLSLREAWDKAKAESPEFKKKLPIFDPMVGPFGFLKKYPEWGNRKLKHFDEAVQEADKASAELSKFSFPELAQNLGLDKLQKAHENAKKLIDAAQQIASYEITPVMKSRIQARIKSAEQLFTATGKLLEIAQKYAWNIDDADYAKAIQGITNAIRKPISQEQLQAHKELTAALPQTLTDGTWRPFDISTGFFRSIYEAVWNKIAGQSQEDKDKQEAVQNIGKDLQDAKDSVSKLTPIRVEILANLAAAEKDVKGENENIQSHIKQLGEYKTALRLAQIKLQGETYKNKSTLNNLRAQLDAEIKQADEFITQLMDYQTNENNAASTREEARQQLGDDFPSNVQQAIRGLARKRGIQDNQKLPQNILGEISAQLFSRFVGEPHIEEFLPQFRDTIETMAIHNAPKLETDLNAPNMNLKLTDARRDVYNKNKGLIQAKREELHKLSIRLSINAAIRHSLEASSDLANKDKNKNKLLEAHNKATRQLYMAEEQTRKSLFVLEQQRDQFELESFNNKLRDLSGEKIRDNYKTEIKQLHLEHQKKLLEYQKKALYENRRRRLVAEEWKGNTAFKSIRESIWPDRVRINDDLYNFEINHQLALNGIESIIPYIVNGLGEALDLKKAANNLWNYMNGTIHVGITDRLTRGATGLKNWVAKNKLQAIRLGANLDHAYSALADKGILQTAVSRGAKTNMLGDVLLGNRSYISGASSEQDEVPRMDLDTIAALSLANIAPEVIRVGQAALGANTAGAVAYGLFSGGTATVAAAIGGYFQAGLERTGAGVLEEHRDLEVGMSSILVALQEPGGLSDMTKSALRYTMMRQGMQLAGTLATDIQETGSAWRTVTDSAKRIAIQWKRSSKTERAGAVAAPFAAGVGGAVAGGAIAVTTGTATGGVATGVGLGAFAVALIAEIAYLSRSNSAAAEELRSQMTQMRLQENENRLREALLKNTKNYTRIEDHDALRDQAEFTAHHLSNLRRSGASEKQIEESFASNLLAGGADQAELNGAIEFLKTSGQVTTTA